MGGHHHHRVRGKGLDERLAAQRRGTEGAEGKSSEYSVRQFTGLVGCLGGRAEGKLGETASDDSGTSGFAGVGRQRRRKGDVQQGFDGGRGEESQGMGGGH